MTALDGSDGSDGAAPDLSVGAILGYARDVLDGVVPMPKGRASRMAALLARQALEDTVRARCQVAGFGLDKATMRSRLIVLWALVDSPGAGTDETGTNEAGTADVAWAGLSQACHQHAYELAPTTGEVRYLVGLVTTLAIPR